MVTSFLPRYAIAKAPVCYTPCLSVCLSVCLWHSLCLFNVGQLIRQEMAHTIMR